MLALSLTYYILEKFRQGSSTEDKDPVILSIIKFEGRKILGLYIKWHGCRKFEILITASRMMMRVTEVD
jgi:hypothetical protein